MEDSEIVRRLLAASSKADSARLRDRKRAALASAYLDSIDLGRQTPKEIADQAPWVLVAVGTVAGQP